jgi:hypothetical protein
MKQEELFPREARGTREELAKERGMAFGAQNHIAKIEWCRDAAREHARRWGIVTIEDVREIYETRTGRKFPAGNWVGSVFKSSEFVPTGRMVKAQHKGSHARLVREWRLR